MARWEMNNFRKDDDYRQAGRQVSNDPGDQKKREWKKETRIKPFKAGEK